WSFMHGGIRAWQLRMNFLGNKIFGTNSIKINIICYLLTPYTVFVLRVYKSAKRKALEEDGYRIRGNMGDQWSDLLGNNPGDRVFKVPDPMYYIG
ncbi:acid phosphatase, class B-like protein, partial [Tanacetum coccineum]